MKDHRHAFRHSKEDLAKAHEVPDTPQTRSPVYRLAFADDDFMCSPELRGVRMQLEMTKPELVMDAEGIESTVVLFGGARVPAPRQLDGTRTETLRELGRFYDEARRFAAEVTRRGTPGQNVVVTGGGPGVMEAGNRGAQEAGGRSIGLGIVLPHEQAPNLYVTPELCFNFHYFATRKMQFLIRAAAVAVFPGGFGTLDELFETLTLIQTGRMDRVPVVLFGEAFWRSIIDWEALAEAGTISPEDLDLFRFVETAEEALAVIDGWEVQPPREDIPGHGRPSDPEAQGD